MEINQHYGELNNKEVGASPSKDHEIPHRSEFLQAMENRASSSSFTEFHNFYIGGCVEEDRTKLLSSQYLGNTGAIEPAGLSSVLNPYTEDILSRVLTVERLLKACTEEARLIAKACTEALHSQITVNMNDAGAQTSTLESTTETENVEESFLQHSSLHETNVIEAASPDIFLTAITKEAISQVSSNGRPWTDYLLKENPRKNRSKIKGNNGTELSTRPGCCSEYFVKMNGEERACKVSLLQQSCKTSHEKAVSQTTSESSKKTLKVEALSQAIKASHHSSLERIIKASAKEYVSQSSSKRCDKANTKDYSQNVLQEYMVKEYEMIACERSVSEPSCSSLKKSKIPRLVKSLSSVFSNMSKKKANLQFSPQGVKKPYAKKVTRSPVSVKETAKQTTSQVFSKERLVKPHVHKAVPQSPTQERPVNLRGKKADSQRYSLETKWKQTVSLVSIPERLENTIVTSEGFNFVKKINIEKAASEGCLPKHKPKANGKKSVSLDSLKRTVTKPYTKKFAFHSPQGYRVHTNPKKVIPGSSSPECRVKAYSKKLPSGRSRQECDVEVYSKEADSDSSQDRTWFLTVILKHLVLDGFTGDLKIEIKKILKEE